MGDGVDERGLAGQVAIVTGASRGLGRYFATDLAQRGAALVITGRTMADLAVTAAHVEAHGGDCVVVEGDVCDESLAERSVRAGRSLGRLAILVNNAGIADGAPFGQLPWEQWWHVYEVNVKATAVWSAAVLPSMVAAGGGRVINVSSGASRAPVPYYSAYGSSKAAISQLTKCLAVEFEHAGVKLFAFGPRAHTDMARHTYSNPAFAPALRASLQAGFEADPDGELTRTLELFGLLTTGAADHLSGEYLGDQAGSTFDDAASVASRTRDTLSVALARLIAPE